MKNAVFWDVIRVALVRTDVSEGSPLRHQGEKKQQTGKGVSGN
jgi:hypothetical protein